MKLVLLFALCLVYTESKCHFETDLKFSIMTLQQKKFVQQQIDQFSSKLGDNEVQCLKSKSKQINVRFVQEADKNQLLVDFVCSSPRLKYFDTSLCAKSLKQLSKIQITNSLNLNFCQHCGQVKNTNNPCLSNCISNYHQQYQEREQKLLQSKFDIKFVCKDSLGRKQTQCLVKGFVTKGVNQIPIEGSIKVFWKPSLGEKVKSIFSSLSF